MPSERVTTFWIEEMQSVFIEITLPKVSSAREAALTQIVICVRWPCATCVPLERKLGAAI
jgi:hypothetical protein